MTSKKLKLILIIIIGSTVWGFGANYSGTVIDTRSKQAISGVLVSVNNDTAVTNSSGYFKITISESTESPFNIDKVASVEIFSIQGKTLAQFKTLSEANAFVLNQTNAVYVLVIRSETGKRTTIICTPQTVQQISSERFPIQKQTSKLKSESSPILHFSKSGYFNQEWSIRNDSIYEMLAISNDSIPYLHKLVNQNAFDLLKGLPLIPKQSQITSVKVIYSLKRDSLYYVNSKFFTFHYDFVTKALGYKGDTKTFNNNEYTNSPKREFILATLNYYEASNLWGLEFFPGDMVSCEQVEKLYNAIVTSSFFGDSLKLVGNEQRFISCSNMPIVTQDQINNNQIYQALTISEGYGYLKKVKMKELTNTYVSRHDFILLDSVPLDINPVSGIITSEFQTPLCHINLLSHNRGTPNMAYRNAWNDAKFSSFENELIYLKVDLDSFVIRKATIDEATTFWNAHEPSKTINLNADTITKGLFELSSSGIENISTIGGKASNVAELGKVQMYYSNISKVPLPEGGFAIPFSYYAQHLKKNKIDTIIKTILADSLFKTNIEYRKTKLQYIQELIKSAPLDSDLVKLVKDKISSNGYTFTYYRFRSSTNTEDIEDFNGAGLYDSYSGSLTDPDKTIEKAIKKVYASLWNYGAFEEREYYKINQLSVEMGILVHRSFTDEVANGVAITSIIYDRPDLQYPGITINTQYGETSITNPDGIYNPEQIICYTFSIDPNNKYIIEYLSKSDVPGKENSTVLTAEEISLLTDICLDIQYHFMLKTNHNVVMDIEFKIDIINGQRKLYIKQARTY